jgi:hypothetical protein
VCAAGTETKGYFSLFVKGEGLQVMKEGPSKSVLGTGFKSPQAAIVKSNGCER